MCIAGRNGALTRKLKPIPTPLRHVCGNGRGGYFVRNFTTGDNPAGRLIVRRQTEIGGVIPAGSSRAERLDPFALPLQFAVADMAADQCVREVELSHERVIYRRAVAGIKMTVNVPVKTYRGVAVRMQPPAAGTPGGVAIVLEHRDPGLSLPLCKSTDGSDIVAEWQAWARVLSLPLLVSDADGKLREPFARLGAMRVAESIARRRKRGMIKSRRPSIFLRRKAGDARWTVTVHAGEYEIIARD
jgi:hypothetical protein